MAPAELCAGLCRGEPRDHRPRLDAATAPAGRAEKSPDTRLLIREQLGRGTSESRGPPETADSTISASSLDHHRTMRKGGRNAKALKSNEPATRTNSPPVPKWQVGGAPDAKMSSLAI